ncbi:hypothetical protein ACHAXT_001326 [Thalassiosira profunda]
MADQSSPPKEQQPLAASDAMADDGGGAEEAEEAGVVAAAPAEGAARSASAEKAQRTTWRPWALLALLAIVGLAVGLGVGLGAKNGGSEEEIPASNGDGAQLVPVGDTVIMIPKPEPNATAPEVMDEPEIATGGASQEEKITYTIEFTVANLDSNDDIATNKFRIASNPNGPRSAVVPNFIAQFGMSSDPVVQEEWEDMGPLEDDPVVASNERGTVTFATSGPNSRTTQMFINTADNRFLDQQGFSSIGEVLPAGDGYGGMEVIDAFYAKYGEKPDQGRIRTEGGEYLEEEFPLLSYFASAEFVDDAEDEDVER